MSECKTFTGLDGSNYFFFFFSKTNASSKYVCFFPGLKLRVFGDSRFANAVVKFCVFDFNGFMNEVVLGNVEGIM